VKKWKSNVVHVQDWICLKAKVELNGILTNHLKSDKTKLLWFEQLIFLTSLLSTFVICALNCLNQIYTLILCYIL
jgi:hypothetical protein